MKDHSQHPERRKHTTYTITEADVEGLVELFKAWEPEEDSTAEDIGLSQIVAERGEVYDSSEQDVVIKTFSTMLWEATRDGGKKRASGEKPPWYEDRSHEAAIFSHLNKWKHGELADKDSGAHPLVHLAWRALAIAYQERYGKSAPKVKE